MLSVVYGHPTVTSVDDPTVAKINGFADVGSEYAYPGNYLVEFFTWMRYIPSSIAKWKRVAEERSKTYSEMFVGMFREVEDRIVRRFAHPHITLSHVISRDKGTSTRALLEL